MVRKELLTVLEVMIPGMILGVWLRMKLTANERLLFIILGVIALLIAARGLYDLVIR